MKKRNLTEWENRELEILSKKGILDRSNDELFDLITCYYNGIPTTDLDENLYWKKIQEKIQQRDCLVVSIYRNLRYPDLFKKEIKDLNYHLLEKPEITDRKRMIWRNLVTGKEEDNPVIKDFLMNYLDKHFPIFLPYDPTKIKYLPGYMVVKKDRNISFLNFFFLMKIVQEKGQQEQTIIKIDQQFLLNEDREFLEISEQWEMFKIDQQFLLNEDRELLEISEQ